MAIQEEGKRGRPIKWDKLFHDYDSKVDYWSSKYKTTPKDRIEDPDVFEDQVRTMREKYGLNNAQAVRLLSHKASLGASVKQFRAYMAGAREIDPSADPTKAANAFARFPVPDELLANAKTKEQREALSNLIAGVAIAKLDEKLGNGWTEADLPKAVVDGTITLSEANAVLEKKFKYSAENSRSDWISQNIFGSD